MSSNRSNKTNDSTAKALGRRARKALAVRQSLFEAGLASFERQPLALVSILDITEAADVAKGVFYLQFKSKDDYLLELWGEVQRRFLDRIRRAVDGTDGEVERLLAAADVYQSFARDDPASARFWIRMSSYLPDEIGPPGALSRIREAYLESLASTLVMPDAGTPDPNDLQRAAALDAIGWALVGASVHGVDFQRDDEASIEAMQAALSTFFHAN